MTKKNPDRRIIAAAVVNGVIFLSAAVVSFIGVVFGAGDGQLGNYVIGPGYFKPYTMDSNILAGIASLIMLIFIIRELRTGKAVPKWAVLVHFMATACLLLTFLIAAAFLAPMMVTEGHSYFVIFGQDMFFFHFLNPMLSILSFTLLYKAPRLSKRDTLFGMIPTIIYSIVYLLMVVVFKKWDDFYNFTFGGQYKLIPIVIIVMYGLILGLSFLLLCLHNRGIEQSVLNNEAEKTG